jgi:hypothetical protein
MDLPPPMPLVRPLPATPLVQQEVIGRMDLVRIGGALVKWPKYFFPPIPTKIGDSIGTSLLVNMPNFQAKKMTGRSPLAVFLIKKCHFTSETGVKPEAY